ncbi:hypothetical protein L228DRAFT_236458 [Xylona heveae TC161]|uniref:Zn(2)-C6 fungal-type domain-containing protein n=1 Tax=Xylona heveae (strain CBS 132557 / TC161) TaxID=1328760 RepID=A0A165IT73_XYLHT|nr:hypothetical protein L228DRAFT_236458 [Xylona heveae TC161]KZF25353.1 hypothetical protein L228DRAFT_236458 [Xylona heveae TC161]
MDCQSGSHSIMRKGNKIPQLSCELCRERKVKCDKLSPCTNCTKTGVSCIPVYRKRRPRGRHVQKVSRNDDLRDRLDRLEAFVMSRESLGASSTPVITPSIDQDVNMTSTPSPPGEGSSNGSGFPKLTAPQTLSSEDSEDEDQDDYGVGSAAIGITARDAESEQSPKTPILDLPLSQDVQSLLCGIYLRHVDPILKILHRPSLCRFMRNGERYLDYTERHPSSEALRSAVCYVAIISMTEEQCISLLKAEKNILADEYRKACEAALERAGLIITKDITVLQSFVLYLAGFRRQGHSRAAWTLLPVAFRIARALRLQMDDHRPSESFFEQQMRKRLWYTLCQVDAQTSFEQASEPLVSLNSPRPSLPRNINDAEFGPESTMIELPDRNDLTDMTHALVRYHAQFYGRLLNFESTPDIVEHTEGSGNVGEFNWEARQRYANAFEQETMALLQNCDPNTSCYAWSAWHGSRCTIALMKLAALRPLHRGGSGAPPRVQGSSHCLQLAAVVLEKLAIIRTDPRGEAFRWHVTIGWPVLAIAIAESYVCKDIILLRRAWPLIEASFEHYRETILTSREGRIWRPLKRLMSRTREKVKQVLGEGSEQEGAGQIQNPIGRDQTRPETACTMEMGSASSSTRSDLPPISTDFDDPWMEPQIDMDPGTARFTSAMPSLHTTDAIPMQSFMTGDSFIPTGNALAGGYDHDIAYEPNYNDSVATEIPQQTLTDPAWTPWEDFVHDLLFSNDAERGVYNEMGQ